jgi:hypothetical protein
MSPWAGSPGRIMMSVMAIFQHSETRVRDCVRCAQILWRRSSTLLPAHSTTAQNARISKVVISRFPPCGGRYAASRSSMTSA